MTVKRVQRITAFQRICGTELTLSEILGIGNFQESGFHPDFSDPFDDFKNLSLYFDNVSGVYQCSQNWGGQEGGGSLGAGWGFPWGRVGFEGAWRDVNMLNEEKPKGYTEADIFQSFLIL